MYDKLVRDKIPNIIEDNDEKPVYYVADDEEYRRRLNEKLKEEVDEYLESEDTEEIADILEVIDAIKDLRDISDGEIQDIKENKNKKRGSFEDKIILDDVVSGEDH